MNQILPIFLDGRRLQDLFERYKFAMGCYESSCYDLRRKSADVRREKMKCANGFAVVHRKFTQSQERLPELRKVLREERYFSFDDGISQKGCRNLGARRIPQGLLQHLHEAKNCARFRYVDWFSLSLEQYVLARLEVVASSCAAAVPPQKIKNLAAEMAERAP